MSETIEKVTEEKNKEKIINKIIDEVVDQGMIKELGINKKIFEICPSFMFWINNALDKIEDGDAEQRQAAISFFEDMERINVIKKGIALDVKDCFHTFKDIEKNTKNVIPKVKTTGSVELPNQEGLSKEEVEQYIKQQLQNFEEELPEDAQNSIIDTAWEMYQGSKCSKQEENENV